MAHLFRGLPPYGCDPEAYKYAFVESGEKPKVVADVGLEIMHEAHEEIGSIYFEIANAVRGKKPIPLKLFKQLGVHPKDTEAVEGMKGVCEFLFTSQYIVFPSLDPGIFFVFEPSETLSKINIQDRASIIRLNMLVKDGIIKPKAVFKLGRKRAQLELCARRIADMVGLKRHSIFGMFAALYIPNIPPIWVSKNDRMTEDLWNGDMKTFDPTTTNGHLVGILEPFISIDVKKTTAKEKLENLARLTILAIILGLRDISIKNIIDLSRFIDMEECFPVRLDPDVKQAKAAAAHHLPYLFEEDLCRLPLPKDLLVSLYKLVKKVDFLELATRLSKIKKKYTDFYHDEHDEDEFPDVGRLTINSGHSDASKETSRNSSSCSDSVSSEDQEDAKLEDSNGSVFSEETEEDEEEEECYKDDGGCQVTINEFHPEVNALFLPNRTEFVFTKRQCSTFSERCVKLGEVLINALQRGVTLSCLDIVKRVDPYFDFQSRHARVPSDVGRTPTPIMSPNGSFVEFAQLLEEEAIKEQRAAAPGPQSSAFKELSNDE